MTELEELKALLVTVQTDGVKALITAEIARLEAEAQTLLQKAESEIEAAIATLSADAQALWAKVKSLI